MNDLLTSIIRTLTAIVVGWVAYGAVKLGVTVNGEAANSVAQTLVTGAVYTVVRTLEDKVSPMFGWLLGYAKPPVYNGGE